jgi:hypothetical protein
MAQADPTNVVGRRIGAWFIDLVIYLIIGIAIGLAFGGGGGAESRELPTSSSAEAFCDTWREDHSGLCFHSSDGASTTVTTFETTLASSGWLPAHFVLYSLIQGITGGSIGKLAVGLRVVTADGRRCGIGRSFLRTALWIVDAITCALPIVGGILLLTTKGHRRVGDLVAKTFVVDKAQEGRPVSVPGLTNEWSGAGQQGYPAQVGGGWPPSSPASGGWGAAPGAGPATTWAPPATGAPASTPAPAGDGPTWDAARNAYIQYDRSQGAWVQWDDGAQAWRPIS